MSAWRLLGRAVHGFLDTLGSGLPAGLVAYLVSSRLYLGEPWDVTLLSVLVVGVTLKVATLRTDAVDGPFPAMRVALKVFTAYSWLHWR